MLGIEGYGPSLLPFGSSPTSKTYSSLNYTPPPGPPSRLCSDHRLPVSQPAQSLHQQLQPQEAPCSPSSAVAARDQQPGSPRQLHQAMHDSPLGPCSTAAAGGGYVEPAVCAGCGCKIADRYFLQAVERQWHAACLRCADCHLPLDAQLTCFARDGQIFCKDDYHRRFGEKRCTRCQASIEPSELVMRARHCIFHLNCFTCVTCQKLLTTGEQYGMKDSLIFCRSHYDDSGLDLGGPVVDLKPLVSAAPPPPPGLLGPPLPGSVPLQSGSSPPGMFPLHDPFLASQCGPDLLPFYNGAGTTTKGRPRKRKGPLMDSESYLHSVGLTMKDGELGLMPDGAYQMPSQRQKRMRTSFKHHQLRIMKSYFGLNHNPDAKDLKQLAQKTGLSKRVLQVWFQNARAKYRRNLLKEGSDGKPMAGGEDGGAGDGQDGGLGPDHGEEGGRGGSAASHDGSDSSLADLSGAMRSPGGASYVSSAPSLGDLHGSSLDGDQFTCGVREAPDDMTDIYMASMNTIN